jgi:hypothetical protein
MHNRIIDLGDGLIANLAISPDIHGNLAIFAFSKVTGIRSQPTNFGAWLFKTDLPVVEYCEAGVAPAQRVAFKGGFELTAHPKLARIV